MDKRIPILLAAEELFADKGFEGTSVRDIAHKAGVNIAMISYYFGSKEKLFEALIEYRSAYTTGILEELRQDQSLTPMEKMYKLIEFYVHRIFSNYRYHTIITRHISTIVSPEVKNLMVSIKERNLDQIRKILGDGEEKGVFRKVDVEMTLATLFGTISQITLAKDFYCHLLGLESPDDSIYTEEMSDRVKRHLKELLFAHLSKPKNEAQNLN